MRKIIKPAIAEYLNEVICCEYNYNSKVLSLFLNIQNGKAKVYCIFYSIGVGTFVASGGKPQEIKHSRKGDYVIYCGRRYYLDKFSRYVGSVTIYH